MYSGKNSNSIWLHAYIYPHAVRNRYSLTLLHPLQLPSWLQHHIRHNKLVFSLVLPLPSLFSYLLSACLSYPCCTVTVLISLWGEHTLLRHISMQAVCFSPVWILMHPCLTGCDFDTVPFFSSHPSSRLAPELTGAHWWRAGVGREVGGWLRIFMRGKVCRNSQHVDQTPRHVTVRRRMMNGKVLV